MQSPALKSIKESVSTDYELCSPYSKQKNQAYQTTLSKLKVRNLLLIVLGFVNHQCDSAACELDYAQNLFASLWTFANLVKISSVCWKYIYFDACIKIPFSGSEVIIGREWTFGTLIIFELAELLFSY